jgi:O-antigen/teichoic acid export membrane protein
MSVRLIKRDGPIVRRLAALLPRGEFGRNVLVVLSGTTAAQAISILVSPILTRLYSPSDFGVYALFLSLATFVTSIAAGKYEMAIVVPEKDEDGINLVAVACVVVSMVSAICLLLLMLFRTEIARLLGSLDIADWLYLVPGMVWLSGVYNALNYWNNRKKRYQQLATNRMTRATLSAGVNVGLGAMHTGAGGLIGGLVVGQAYATGLFGRQVWKSDQGIRGAISLSAVQRQARRYSDFPKFLIPSGLVESGLNLFPLTFFSSYFGVAILGFFSLAVRIVSLPLALISQSIGDVFRQRAGEEYARTGNCRTLFLRVFKRLFLLSFVPFGIILVLGPTLFAWVFGEQWRVAGEYCQIMTVMFWLRFISSPLSSMFYIAEKQKWDLIIQTVTFIAMVGGLIGLTYGANEPKFAVVIYSGIYTVKYLIELFLSYRFSQNFNITVKM